jgi:hypothetical protein
MSKKIFFTFVVLILVNGLFFTGKSLAEDFSLDESAGTPTFIKSVINYFHSESKLADKTPMLKLSDAIVVFIVDLVISLFCLWLALVLLPGAKAFVPVKYAWLLLFWNLSWYVILVVLNFIWIMLSFLVVRLRPDLKLGIIDFLTTVAFITAICLFIWVLARTFSLNFKGALGTFLLAHLLYALLIFLISLGPQESRFFELVKENLGVRPALRNYIADVAKITSDKGMDKLLRVRGYRL